MNQTDANRILEIGKDVSKWPLLKLKHAQQLSKELRQSFQSYRDRIGRETETVISEDGLKALIRARLTEAPPVEDWSLRFGDIIHNYRSALDGLTWGLAHLDNRVPHERYRKKIYFPFAESPTKWRNLKTKELASIPEFVLDRLEQVQPFHSLPVEKSIGIILHKLDIEDKHRSLLSVRLVTADKTHYAIQTNFRDELPEAAQDAGRRLTDTVWCTFEEDLQNGDLVAEHSSRYPMEKVILEKLPLQLRVSSVPDNSNVFDLLAHIEAQVVGTFDAVLKGFMSKEFLNAVRSGRFRLGKPA